MMDQNKKNKIKNVIIVILAIGLIILSLDRIKLHVNNQITDFNNTFSDRTIGICSVKVTNMKYACGDNCPELFRIDQVMSCEGDSLYFINKEMTVIFQKESLRNIVESNLNNKFIFEGRIQSNSLGLLRMLVNDVTPIKDSNVLD